MEEIRKAMKLKNKKSRVSEGYKVQVSFFLKISNQFARELSLNPPARKTLWSRSEQGQDLARDTAPEETTVVTAYL